MRFVYFFATVPLNLWRQAPLATSARWSKAPLHGNRKKKNRHHLKPGAQGAGTGLPLGVTDAQESNRRMAWRQCSPSKGSGENCSQPLAVCLIRCVPLRLPLWRKTDRLLSLKDGVTQSVASLLWSRGWAGTNPVCYSSMGLTRVSPAGPPEPGNLEVSSGQQKQKSMKVQAAFSRALLSWNDLRENAKTASVFRE